MNAEYGKVYLVGAGPGDPELLTRKAVKILRMAEVVLYDDLVSSKILKLCRKKTELIYVGKRLGQHSCQQIDLNQKIADAALQYKTVIRLKGGDPSIFGRVGEEVEFLLNLGIECEIVAGITTASGAVASLGFPLTHREYSKEILYVTGHGKNGKNSQSFKNLSCEGKTLVVYMGLNSLKEIVDDLVESGNPESLPVGIVENATLAHQRIVTGNLGNIRVVAEKSEVSSPALLIIGDIIDYYLKMDSLRALIHRPYTFS
ncbi:uroporphyrinogen-III C-methyltransferase [Leptospira yasudae]|uniref:uroporphyrinogen-III C-methyltransferase n=1 Tax=Leptospira yasudae TaxID=2202201 RepID=A0ABX9M7R9_9LEPT|nr:uroporphyrinogen-III C-methyltransferase [Leptospira yasudae]RHX82129.1 uroporphyrinogen-III C-methyltransferase [Leptospira yasudae]RHX95074.1 uroporphyrinogen-III C-methyltransferase [Leptospira yasudae]